MTYFLHSLDLSPRPSIPLGIDRCPSRLPIAPFPSDPRLLLLSHRLLYLCFSVPKTLSEERGRGWSHTGTGKGGRDTTRRDSIPESWSLGCRHTGG